MAEPNRRHPGRSGLSLSPQRRKPWWRKFARPIRSGANWSTSNPLWDHRSLTFTADDTSAVLRFASLDAGVQGAIIADIQVIEIPAAVTTILNNDPTLSYNAATGKFYRFVNSAVSWTNAVTGATSAGLNGVSGQLATVSSAYENEVVRDIVSSAGWSYAWLGGSDSVTEGDFRWYEGDTPDELFWQGAAGGSAQNGNYTNFRSGEPSDSGGQDFVVLRVSDGTWDDSNANNGYVIEWDASEVLSSFTFSLTDDAGGRFAIDSNTGEVTVADGWLID